MERLGFDLQRSAELLATTEEAIKTSEIEGEMLNPDSVRSSVARHLGVPEAAISKDDRKVEGIVEMTLDATKNFGAPLTRDRLFGWQAALFPTGRSGLQSIIIGRWRGDAHGPMQVVSAAVGRDRVSTTKLRQRRASSPRWKPSSHGSTSRRRSTVSFTLPSRTSGL